MPEQPRITVDSVSCPYCGHGTHLTDNHTDIIPGIMRQRAASAFWRECSHLACRARGPKKPTPEAANLAFLTRTPPQHIGADPVSESPSGSVRVQVRPAEEPAPSEDPRP